MSQFSNALTAAMSRYHMKLATLAMLLRVSEDEARKWTMGTGFPDDMDCYGIAQMFGLEYTSLLEAIDKDREKMQTTAAYEYLIKRVRQLAPAEAVEIYKTLTEEAASGN